MKLHETFGVDKKNKIKRNKNTCLMPFVGVISPDLQLVGADFVGAVG